MDARSSKYNARTSVGSSSVRPRLYPSLGVFLISTACLKTYHAVASPLNISARVTANALILVESLVGAWLMIGTPSLVMWGVSVACFTEFAGVSGINALDGKTS
jgi:hypothetical protein